MMSLLVERTIWQSLREKGQEKRGSGRKRSFVYGGRKEVRSGDREGTGERGEEDRLISTQDAPMHAYQSEKNEIEMTLLGDGLSGWGFDEWSLLD